jgi:hypothetical protein
LLNKYDVDYLQTAVAIINYQSSIKNCVINGRWREDIAVYGRKDCAGGDSHHFAACGLVSDEVEERFANDSTYRVEPDGGVGFNAAGQRLAMRWEMGVWRLRF